MSDFEHPYTTPPMNPDVKKAWVEALRSDNYKQGVGALCIVTPNKQKYHCCLGVLCDLYGGSNDTLPLRERVVEVQPSGVVPSTTKERYGQNAYTLMYALASSTLPTAVSDWAGLRDDNPRFAFNTEVAKAFAQRTHNLEEEDADHTSLAHLNDHGYTFAEIADIIEKYL